MKARLSSRTSWKGTLPLLVATLVMGLLPIVVTSSTEPAAVPRSTVRAASRGIDSNPGSVDAVEADRVDTSDQVEVQETAAAFSPSV